MSKIWQTVSWQILLQHANVSQKHTFHEPSLRSLVAARLGDGEDLRRGGSAPRGARDGEREGDRGAHEGPATAESFSAAVLNPPRRRFGEKMQRTRRAKRISIRDISGKAPPYESLVANIGIGTAAPTARSFFFLFASRVSSYFQKI